MNLDYTTGFTPRTEVMELWKALPTEEPKKLEILARELERLPRVEVFREVLPSRVEVQNQWNRMVYDFFHPQFLRSLPRKQHIDEFASLAIENVFQHADPDIHERRWFRGIQTEKPYARACVVAELQKGKYLDIYVMDDGIGFVHPETGEPIMAQALERGVGFGAHSQYKEGCGRSLTYPDECMLISANQWVRKQGPYRGLTPVESAPPEFQGIKGTLVCGRFYHPSVRDEMRNT